MQAGSSYLVESEVHAFSKVRLSDAQVICVVAVAFAMEQDQDIVGETQGEFVILCMHFERWCVVSFSEEHRALVE